MQGEFLFLTSLTIANCIVVYQTSQFTKNIFLLKKCKPKDFSKITEPPKLESTAIINFDKINELEISPYIKKFDSVITKFFSKEDLANYYNNVNNLKFNKNKFLLLFQHASGSYSPNNTITVDERFLQGNYSTTYHELFHMASSVCDNKKHFTGFSITYGLSVVGKGLNEGYTEFLTKRYFNNGDLTDCSYRYLVYHAKLVEEIVGKEKMQSLYLNANLKGLIEELTNYSSIEDVMNFISAVDYIHEYIYCSNSSSNSKIISNLNASFKNVYLFLMISYFNKLENTMNEHDKIKEVAYFISYLPKKVEYDCCEYEIFNDELLNELFLRLGLLEEKSLKKV